jgi:hypothetical protein
MDPQEALLKAFPNDAGSEFQVAVKYILDECGISWWHCEAVCEYGKKGQVRFRDPASTRFAVIGVNRSRPVLLASSAIHYQQHVTDPGMNGYG